MPGKYSKLIVSIWSYRRLFRVSVISMHTGIFFFFSFQTSRRCLIKGKEGKGFFFKKKNTYRKGDCVLSHDNAGGYFLFASGRVKLLCSLGTHSCLEKSHGAVNETQREVVPKVCSTLFQPGICVQHMCPEGLPWWLRW